MKPLLWQPSCIVWSIPRSVPVPGWEEKQWSNRWWRSSIPERSRADPHSHCCCDLLLAQGWQGGVVHPENHRNKTKHVYSLQLQLHQCVFRFFPGIGFLLSAGLGKYLLQANHTSRQKIWVVTCLIIWLNVFNCIIFGFPFVYWNGMETKSTFLFTSGLKNHKGSTTWSLAFEGASAKLQMPSLGVTVFWMLGHPLMQPIWFEIGYFAKINWLIL